MIAVQVENLTKELGGRLVLNGISFDVHQGEIFGVIGMSGSGKTTLLNHLIGFLDPDEGEVRYHSNRPMKGTKTELEQMRKNMRDVRRMFGFSPQTPSFYPRLTIKENLTHFGVLHKVDRKSIEATSAHLLELTQLEAHKNKLAEHLSGGMQRRLSIMCGLIHKPEVLILDEPTSDLDPLLRDETWKLIKEINKLGTTIIIASHFLEELERVCDRVAIISNGTLLKHGTLDEIKKSFAKDAIEIEIDTKPEYVKVIMQHFNKRNVDAIRREEDKVRILTKHPQEVLFELARMLRSGRLHAYSLEVHRPTLREVFEKIMREK